MRSDERDLAELGIDPRAVVSSRPVTDTLAQATRRSRATASAGGRSGLERSLALVLASLGRPFVEEHRFHPARKWRFDFAYPDLLIGIEAEGVSWTASDAGRHQRAAGFSEDCLKYGEAAVAGWMVLRFTDPMISDGTARALIDRALTARGASA